MAAVWKGRNSPRARPPSRSQREEFTGRRDRPAERAAREGLIRKSEMSGDLRREWPIFMGGSGNPTESLLEIQTTLHRRAGVVRTSAPREILTRPQYRVPKNARHETSVLYINFSAEFPGEITFALGVRSFFQ